MKYEFYEIIENQEKKLLMQIEADIDLTPIILEYRGKNQKGEVYAGESKGYLNIEGKYANSYEDASQKNVEITKNGKLITPSSRADKKFFTLDYRRVLGDILFCTYNEKILVGKIDKICIGGKKYTEIKNVKFSSDNDKRLAFDARCENNHVSMCIPIALDKPESNLPLNSQEELYCLKAGDSLQLELYKKYNVYNHKTNNDRGYELDLFYGKNNGNTGIYYYLNNELLQMYEVTKEDEIQWTNVRECFWRNENSSICTTELDTSDLGKSLKICCEKICNSNVVLKEDYIEFEKSVNKFIWEKEILKSEIKYEKGLIGKKQTDGTYKFTHDSGIGYCARPDVHDAIGNSFCYEFTYTQLGKVCIDNFYIELDCELSNWIIGDTIGESAFRVKKDILSNIISFINLKFPEAPAPKDQHFFIEYIMERYIKDNESLIVQLKREMEKVLHDENDSLNYLIENSVSLIASDVNEIKRILYPTPMVADMAVVTSVYEAKKIYEDTGKMPNYAIMGGPGTGKSTLIKGIAKCLLGANYSDDKILYKSTSDLKGAYIGHTSKRMFDLLKDAAEKEQVIFIDEAYNLLKDNFGKEALEICLPLLTGDRKEIESPATSDQEARVYSFEKEGKNIPPIWFAGYEHEMRKMLSENPGLYRRMTKMTLSSPTVEGLYDCLIQKCGNDSSLRKQFESNKDAIRNYFDWATSREKVSYFGNYAGVNEFFTTCKARIGTSDNDNIVKETIDIIIDEKKKEIKKQYKAILEDAKKIEFEIQNEVDVILDDVKGNDKTVNSLRGIVNMMMNQEEYQKKGINLPKGALLMGPPGTGKTMLARAVAGEIQKRCRDKEKKDVKVAFIATIATELGSPSKISALFDEAAEYNLSIVFIDEIDAIGKHRNRQGAHPELLIQLMKELDGFEARKNIFVMAATNDPDSLDPALKRTGRFDRTIEVTYPNQKGRKEILKSALLKLKIFNNKGQEAEKIAEKLADKTRQYAPANLINLVNEAAILYEECNNLSYIPAHRKDLDDKSSAIDKFEKDILEELERLVVGEANFSDKEKRFNIDENKGCSAVAIHEVGHAMVSLLLGLEPFESITILPRGDALGYVKPNNLNQLWTKKDYLNQIRMCLGGRVAEELFYGDNISTGAAQDIQQATQYAEQMVTLFGMNDAVGPMALKTQSNGYLGDNSNYLCSESFRYEADDAIRKLLSEQLSITRNMLENQKGKIEEMAQFIFNRESATGEEFKRKYEEKE